MFKNYIQIAIRNLIKYKTFTFINIAGLALGITCFLILSLFVIDEIGYESFNKDADNIYRIYVHSILNGQESNNSKTAAPLGITLLRNYPEVINFARIGYFGQHDLRYKNNSFREWNIYTADSTYFGMFTLPFIYGNPESALNYPNSVVITEDVAKKYFGNENPLGKTFIVDDTGAWQVTGVIKNFPKKSHFSCGFLLSMSTYPVTANNNWLDLWYTTYIKLRKGTDAEEFDNKLQRIVQVYFMPQAERVLGTSTKNLKEKGNAYEYHIQPLKSIYLYSLDKYGIDKNTEWSSVKTSSIEYSYIFMAIGSFILLIAIFNFMNLSTARSEKRSKEVGIRKTLGSSKFMLIKQFLIESIIICFMAVLISLALVEMILPLFNSFVGRQINAGLFNNVYVGLALLLFTIIVGIIAGSYPAFYLSSFEPSQVLANKQKDKRKNFVRSTLVIFQFSISITLIIGTIIIKEQLDYIQEKNLGFNRDDLITIDNPKSLGDKVETFKAGILNNPNIISATVSSLMFQTGIPGNGYLYNKTIGTDVLPCEFLDVDYDFLKTFQIKMQKGRYFSRAFPADSSAVIINEEAVDEFNAIEPIGKKLSKINGETGEMEIYKIIGIINNFNYESLHQKIRPLVLHLSSVNQAASELTVRVNAQNMKGTINFIKAIWDKLSSRENFSWNFLNQDLARMYESDDKIGTITSVFSVLAIIIACLGLFGLAAFVTEQRTREIGIRKVLGASVTEIMLMLSKEILQWVIIANLVAWPVAYLFMNNWLLNFAYKTHITPWVFIISGGLALLIALLTVSLQAIKVASVNPIDSLKYE